MRDIWISDITISQSSQSKGFSLSFREKIELAKLLDKVNVSVIEVGQTVKNKTDSLMIKSLALAVSHSGLAVPVDLSDENSPALVWSALKEAKKPRLQVPAPVSTVQMEYICHKKPPVVLEMIGNMVKRCCELCPEVEFLALDASRSEPEFLKSAIETAVQAGAKIVTVCDTAGTMLPDEFKSAVETVRGWVPETVRLGVSCANTLYMADSCAMAAIRGGADEVKVTACGDATASLEKLTRILAAKGDQCGAHSSVRATEIQRTINQIRWMCETQRSKSSPFDSGVREDRGDMVLSVHDSEEAVMKAVEKLGYDLGEEDVSKVYDAFLRIAEKKEFVGARELDAIVASAALQVPPTYRIESYVINSGNIITATAHMKIKKGEESVESVCIGDGPVDASFLAIEQIVGHHYELDDFQIQSVTEGREAMGETVVRLRSNGKLYSGRGISTDVIGSSIRAYINAVNKIVYEEGEA